MPQPPQVRHAHHPSETTASNPTSSGHIRAALLQKPPRDIQRTLALLHNNNTTSVPDSVLTAATDTREGVALVLRWMMALEDGVLRALHHELRHTLGKKTGFLPTTALCAVSSGFAPEAARDIDVGALSAKTGPVDDPRVYARVEGALHPLCSVKSQRALEGAGKSAFYSVCQPDFATLFADAERALKSSLTSAERPRS